MKAKTVLNDDQKLRSDIPNLVSEIQKYFGNKGFFPDEEIEIKIMSATEYWAYSLEVFKEFDFPILDDFSDEEIPLMMDDIYAAAYEYNLETGQFRIIDSLMSQESNFNTHDDFNLSYLKKHITDKINYITYDGNVILWLNRI